MAAASNAQHTGLSAAEVRSRVEAGRTNAVDTRTSRTYGEIVRANVFTFFNGLLFTLFLIVLATGRWQNALFGGVVAANAAIGIVQEVRAKRTLDRLAVLNAPHARVLREGVVQEIPAEQVVADETLELRSGDQVVADGTVLVSDGLEIDESLLTGESDPVAKVEGDPVRSGSIVIAGGGLMQADAVGDEAYAARMAAEARRFTVTRSELMEGTTRLMRWISVMMLVVGPILLWSQFHSADNHGWADAITGSVAALVGMVPEGLVLLTSLAFMLATVALARRQTLVQELPAIEGLARVDVVCLDKTGTLTHGDMVFDHLEVLGGDEAEVRSALGMLVDDEDGNATATAVAAAVERGTWTAVDEVPFSSARKWSAMTAADHGSWVFGAPEMVLPTPTTAAQHTARERADALASAGSRVLMLASSAQPPQRPASGEAILPPDLHPQALVVLAENLREDAAETLRYFTDQGVGLKVISGDNPRTVGAVAAKLGVPGVSGPDDAVDARTLSEDPAELADQIETHSVFGRVTPYQKRAFVAALQSRGHVVAMTGDGVNDALALKDADIGVAMVNGSPATRAVAQIVLLDGRFSHLPDVVAEGRRVMANIERAAGLFLVKNAYSVVLALISALTVAAYPLEPIQLSLISDATIGIPAFFLALGPNTRRYLPGFLRRVLWFAIPTGIVVGLCTYGGYWYTRIDAPGSGVAGARTTATLIVLVSAMWVLLASARPLSGWKLGLVATVAAAVVGILAIPSLAHGLFLLDLSVGRVLTAAVWSGIALAGIVLLQSAARIISMKRP
ncbi:HAD-IC family P-type ATPase [Nocardioides sp.]|uniref:HAD-IC family P-type ATPase n=1 Tax=Nocardioides sp. TaxID=35761 RepID=UPI0026236505|nr:HAD-IC family P-type ATPase [Nocardioides sp.]